MAKVKEEVVKAAVVKLVDSICATMPSTIYKFVLGGAASFLGMGGLNKIKSSLSVFKDEHGYVDTQKVRQMYESAFKASGGKLQIELFNKPDSLLSMFIKPITLTITQADIDALMVDVEKNAVLTEVTLPTAQPTIQPQQVVQQPAAQQAAQPASQPQQK